MSRRLRYGGMGGGGGGCGGVFADSFAFQEMQHVYAFECMLNCAWVSFCMCGVHVFGGSSERPQFFSAL